MPCLVAGGASSRPFPRRLGAPAASGDCFPFISLVRASLLFARGAAPEIHRGLIVKCDTACSHPHEATTERTRSSKPGGGAQRKKKGEFQVFRPQPRGAAIMRQDLINPEWTIDVYRTLPKVEMGFMWLVGPCHPASGPSYQPPQLRRLRGSIAGSSRKLWGIQTAGFLPWEWCIADTGSSQLPCRNTYACASEGYADVCSFWKRACCYSIPGYQMTV